MKSAILAVNSLSEAQESCKKGCDADNGCKFAHLFYGTTKWCKHFDSRCTISAQGTLDGHYVYAKGNYEDLNYIFIEIFNFLKFEMRYIF